ncbi:MAG: 2-polyprenyl-3-methyl-6-methoxy-1,4-benzoquinone monooxygenase [Burkholderiaceae bacterium]|nr:2-polyprenyl-3-methyl-6-methoxy-1,4-benzoquinone monooxygenase [Burkholderiaceae bacterium]
MSTLPVLSPVDRALALCDRALRTLAGRPPSGRPYPADAVVDDAQAPEMTDAERNEAAALMRVNHVGEICAQALYEAQALGTPDARLRETFMHAAREEADHLAWTQRRIEELGGRTSLLNPLWYAGAFGIGLLAARLGDRVSLGFMAETERQVEHHLQGHLDRLPAADTASRAIVEQMKVDEVTHGQTAMQLGGVALPAPVRGAMQLAARLMTTTAYRI